MRLYHFTSIDHWQDICRSGYLKLQNSDLMMGGDFRTRLEPVVINGEVHGAMTSANNDPGVVWFTSNPARTKEAHKWARECKLIDKTRVRIEVEIPDDEVSDWEPWCKAMIGDNRVSSMFMNSQKDSGDWKNWFVCLRKVTEAEWIEVIDLDDRETLWRKEELHTPVTKDDIDFVQRLLKWLDMSGTPAVIMNGQAFQGWQQYSSERGAPDYVADSFFEDRVFVFLEPKPFTIKGYGVLAMGYRFHTEGDSVQAHIKAIVGMPHVPLTAQRWNKMMQFEVNSIPMSRGGQLMTDMTMDDGDRRVKTPLGEPIDVELAINSFVPAYVTMMGFLATPYVLEERRKPREQKKRGKKRGSSNSDVTVAVFRRPERLAAKALKRVAAEYARDGHKLEFEVNVSGHYRDQWYPSVRSHKRIWIADHKKGPEGVKPPVQEKQRIIKAVR